MKINKKLVFASALAACAAAPAVAEITELPASFYDDFAVSGYVNTASKECAGASVNQKNFNKLMNDTLVEVSAAGLDPVEAVNFLTTDVGTEQMQMRETAFRARHGVAETGYDGLCQAIKAEADENKDFRKLVKFKN